MQHIFDQLADWCSILGFFIGIPSLIAIYFQLRATRKQRERSAMAADTVWFENVRDNSEVNIADFAEMRFLPRIGEEITMPGPETSPEYGHYRVVKVHYFCGANDSQDAPLAGVTIELEPIHAEIPRT